MNEATSDRTICFCFGTTERDIRDHFADPNATVPSLVERTEVGTRCTACLLDVDVILEGIHREGVRTLGVRAAASEPLYAGRLRQPIDMANSAFFVSDGDITTTLRVANYGELFERPKTVVPYDYNLFVIDEGGRVRARRRGRLDVFAELEIELASLDGCPEYGWLLFSLFPLGQGLSGSTRPYLILRGNDWAASMHMQRHSMQTRRGRRTKTITIPDDRGQLAMKVSIINASRRRASVEVAITSANGFHAEQSLSLSPRGSTLAELDILFPDRPDSEFFVIDVLSDRPTRKHLVNVHQDGSWSIDHFPDVAG